MSDVSSTRSLQAKLADLHIFVVPVELWLDKYRTAFNNIALESVSAGFVRVHPDLSLRHLRECLEEQLGEEVIPEEFIFLRSVGRCMAVVKENQEHLLKVKDFLPPIAYSPEIFLLPGSHETYARPGTDPNNVVIATRGHTTAGMSSTNPFHLPLITQSNLVTQTGYINPQDYHGNLPGQEDGYDQRSKLKQAQRDSFDSDQINSSLEDNDSGRYGDNQRRVSGESEDSGYTPRRQKKETLSRESEKKKTTPKSKEHDNHTGRASPVEIKTVKIIEPQVVHSMPFQGPDGHLMAPPTPIPSGRVIASPVPVPRKSKTDNKTKESKKKNKNKAKRSRSSSLDRQKANRTEEMEKMEAIPGENDVIPTIEDVEERSKYAQFPSPAKSTRSPRPYANENELDSGIAEDFVTPPQNLNNSLEDSKDAKDKSKFKRQKGFEKTDDNIDKLPNGDKAGKDDLLNKQNSTDLAHGTDSSKQNSKSENNTGQNAGKVAKTVTRKPRKTVKKTVKKPTDDLDEKLKKLKNVEPPPLAVPDPGSVSFEKDTHSAKDRKQRVIEELRGQLRKAKNERVDLEKQRDQKVRRAKSLQTQTLQKRNQGKNIWKKKFFDEKRKTAPLEEQLNRLRYDVEVQHKTIVDLLESKDREGGKGGKDQDKTPSEKTNQLMLLARIQNEVEDLKHKIEELKMRLASEMKLRDNAQRELKQLREDLIEKKINLTLTKSQKSLAVLNPTNITAQ